MEINDRGFFDKKMLRGCLSEKSEKDVPARGVVETRDQPDPVPGAGGLGVKSTNS